MKNSIILFTVLCLPLSLNAVEVSKADWVDGMSTALPTAFCNSGSYFRQCFGISAEECEETAISATRVCLSKEKDNIPDVLVQPEDGRHWGTKVGQCAGTAFEITLIDKRTDNEKCNNVSNWQ